MSGFKPKDPAGTTEGVTANQAETLAHFKFNPVAYQLEADVAISSTLNSFFFQNQGSLSAAGQTFVFSNVETGLDSFPLSIHYRDQFISGNDADDGWIYPYIAEPSNLLSIDVSGAAHASNTTIYQSSSTLGGDQLVFGIEFIVEQNISPTDFLFYHVHHDDENGNKMFSQTKTGLTLVPGQRFVWEFSHPVELGAGEVVYNDLSTALTRIGQQSGLIVRATDADPNIAYVLVHTRALTQKPISTREYARGISGAGEFPLADAAGLNTIHQRDGSMILTRAGNYILWDLSD